MSNLKVETARKLDISSVKSVYSPSKSCGISQNRRFRSYSATLNRNASDDQAKKLVFSTPKKLSSNNANQASVSSGVGFGSACVKRRHGSFSAGGSGCGFKRRKKESGIVPPTKFLLGGNITDPLNLNSFLDETGRSPNQATPSASPLPVPKSRSQVDVLIPPNINDPLNLNACEEDAEMNLNLVSPKTKKRRRKNRNKKNGSEEMTTETVCGKWKGEVMSNEVESKPVVPNTLALITSTSHAQLKYKKAEDKIVSPVIPQPGSRKNRSGGHPRSAEAESSEATSDQIGSKGPQRDRHHRQRKQSNPSSQSGPAFRAKDAQFRYGNYSQYYGYRNPKFTDDYRLDCLKREWFEGKDVLDVGCNIGHITLSIARDFEPKKIVGIDIDPSLIRIARRNVCHYMTDRTTADNTFPISFSICCGPIVAAAAARNDDDDVLAFPNNVCFVEGNYVLESNELLEMQRPEFDTVVCLSVTKWVHLNWGDDGIKRFFKRIFLQLHPGGRLLLEAQAFNSYKKKKKLTEDIFRNYERIQLKPEHFTEYLLSKEVGFSKCQVIDTPFNVSKGFRRPIQLFIKGSSPTET